MLNQKGSLIEKLKKKKAFADRLTQMAQQLKGNFKMGLCMDILDIFGLMDTSTKVLCI